MKILQIIIQDGTVLLFTEQPAEDVEALRGLFTDDYDAPTGVSDDSSIGFPLGYEAPSLTKFTFLGTDYPCISLWFDNEDIPSFFTDFTPPNP